jgi:hypothetical protein
MAGSADAASSPVDGGSPAVGAPADTHYALVVKAMAERRLVPFLGAGASLCGRPRDASYEPRVSDFLPRASELAKHLADEFIVPSPSAEGGLLGVSQYIDVMVGRDWLYEKLHELFAGTYQPNALHDFLARLPRKLFVEKGSKPRYQLIVTTNYDDALERAFEAVEEPFHLVWYIAEGEDRGRFMHRAPDGTTSLVLTPNDYVEVSTDDCTVILKIHGAVNRTADSTEDSYVITEDHYIEFLTGGTEIGSLVPIELANVLKKGNFLFLGYSLRDWNLRVILRRIWSEQKIPGQSWAIQKESEDYDRQFWNRRNVQIRSEDLSEYVAELDRLVALFQPKT